MYLILHFHLSLIFLDTWTLEHLNTWVLEYLNTWNTRILEHLNVETLEHWNTRLFTSTQYTWDQSRRPREHWSERSKSSSASSWKSSTVIEVTLLNYVKRIFCIQQDNLRTCQLYNRWHCKTLVASYKLCFITKDYFQGCFDSQKA